MSSQLTPFASNSSHPQKVPKEEESILNYLLDVRAELAKLKQNRTEFLSSKQVQIIYQNVLTKVRKLDDIRKSSHDTPSRSATTLIHDTELHNRVDSVLDDVFQLLSLCFLTVGLKNSAPATYSSLSTVQSLLEHLSDSKMFTTHDLKPIKERLDEIQVIVEKSSYRNEESKTFAEMEGETDQELLRINRERTQNNIEEDLLVRAKLQHCLEQYEEMEAKIEKINPSLSTIMEKLYHIRRGLLSLASQSNDGKDKNGITNKSKHNLDKLKKELSSLETNRDESGYFRSLETNEVVMEGQGVLNKLVDDCHDLINDLSHTQNGDIVLDPKLQPIYKSLIDIKTNLANLMVTRRWTLRETDLFAYQKKLSEIDNMRVNGKFPSATADAKGQSIILYLLRRCYAIIYKLLESSEPISESLQYIHTQLSTVRRCLLTLKRMGGVSEVRELYPYQMKLASLDELRVDGIFYDSNGDIPEGQGILNAILSECFDMLHELKIQAENSDTLSTNTAIGTKASYVNLAYLSLTESGGGIPPHDDHVENHDQPQPIARDLGVHNMDSDDDKDNSSDDESGDF